MFLSACNADKIAQLEKQNKEFRAELEKQKQMVDLDTQAKCSTAAQGFFQRNYSVDKATLLLNFHNHYNRALGKCFITTEWHYKEEGSKTGSWYNLMYLHDVYENQEYGRLHCRPKRSDSRKSLL